MTLVRIAMFRPDESGVDVPANGTLYWAASKRRTVDDYVFLPTRSRSSSGRTSSTRTATS